MPRQDDYQDKAREVWEPVGDPLMAGWMMRRKPWPPRFRSPAGEEMAANTYGAHRKRIHREEAAPAAAEPHAPIGVPDLPDSKPDRASPEIKRAGLATPAELADTAFIALLLLTALIAFFTRIPEFAMTQDEARALAVPIGNIAERSAINRNYGQYLKDGSDYLTVGYVLYAWLSRVQQQVQARTAAQQQQAPQARPGPSAPPRPMTAPPPPPSQPSSNGAQPQPEAPPYAGASPFGPRAGQPQ